MAKIATGVALAAGAVAMAVTPGLQFASPMMMHALIGSMLSMGASMTLGGIAEDLRGGPGFSGSIRQPTAARQCVYGQCRISGTVLYTNTTGHQLNQIIAWASHPIQSIDAIYLDGRQFHGVPYPGSPAYQYGDGVTYQDPSGNNYSFGHGVFVGNQALGSSSGFWYDALYNQNNAYWDSSNMLKGIAASYIKLTYDSSVFSGTPNIKATIHGRSDIYDPRTGLTGYSNNAALVIANFLCDPTFGIGCSWSEIDQTQLIAAANTCDELVPLAAGGSEKRYTINGFFDTNTAPGDILDSMLMACAGRISYSGGLWKIYPGAWYGSTLSFTQNDIVDKIQWTPTRKYRERCNAVRATFVCPCYPYEQTGYDKDHKNSNVFSGEWQPADAPEYAQDSLHGYASDVNLTTDGGNKLYTDLRYQFVTSVGQAQRLMKIHLMRNRQMGSGHLTMDLGAYQTVAQDVIQLTAPALTWTNKYLEVQQTHLVPHFDQKNPTITVKLDVAETDPSVYSWSTAEERTVQNNNSPTLDLNTAVEPPTNLTLTDDSSTAIMQQDGTSMSRMLVSWTPPNDPFVTTGGHIQIQYQLTTRRYVVTPIWTLLGTSSNGDGSYSTGWVDVASVSGNANNYYIDGIDQYEGINVRIRSVRANGAYSAWVNAIQSGGAVHIWGRPIPVIGTNTTTLKYGDGTLIESLKPLESGAEKTTGKSIDILTDGSTYRRVASQHVTTGGVLQYTSGGTIDSLKPAEAGAQVVSGKSIDILSDGSTYARTIASRVNSGKPVVDFSEGIHYNKNLDYIPNGGSNFSVSQVDGNRRAIVDFSVGHYNKHLGYISDGGGRYAAGEAGADVTNYHVLTSRIATPTTGVYQDTSGTLRPLASTVYATGNVTTYGTTTVGWYSGNQFTTGSSWVGKRIAINSGSNTYVRTIQTVSSSGVLIVDSTVPSISVAQYQVWSDFGWSLTTVGAGDVYNVSASVAAYLTSGVCTMSVGISVDGGAAQQVSVYTNIGSSGVPYFASLTGLSAGTHTIVVVSGVNTSTVTATANAMCQRIF